MALSLDSPAHAPESLACFERGKGCERTAMPARRGTGNTPQHGGCCCRPGTVTQWDGEAKGRCRCPGLSEPTYLGSDKELKTSFLLFLVSSCPLVCLSVCQTGRKALLMSEYCIYIHGYTHIYIYSVTDGYVLCASYFFSPVLVMSSLLCYSVCGHT